MLKIFVKSISRKKYVVSPWTSGGLRAKQKSVGALCFRFHPKPLNTLTVAKLATQCTSWTLPFLLLVVWNKLPSLKMKWNFFHDFFPSAFNHKGPSSWVDDASFTESKYNRKKMDQLKGEKKCIFVIWTPNTYTTLKQGLPLDWIPRGLHHSFRRGLVIRV